MKVARLDLLAFGPFTHRSLLLHEGQQGLHLIYGLNEAGKSSALRALWQWLYGIPHASDDNFLHRHSELRVGGCLELSHGERWEFIRRKGRSRTARGPDDQSLFDESRLASVLTGIDERVFRQRYGIDYEQLRQGGQAIVAGGGELGEILFAAGAGLADVRQLQSEIDGQLQALFKPAGSQPRINDLLRQWNGTRQAMKQSQLPTSDWTRLDKALRSVERRQLEIDGELRTQRAEKNRLERLQHALPCSLRRRQLSQQLESLADTPLLPADFAEQRGRAQVERDGARRAAREAEREIQQLRQAIDEQPQLAPQLLQQRALIVQLHSDLGGHQKAARDRPGLIARLERAQQQQQQLVCELADLLGSDRSLPQKLTRVQRGRIQSLAQDFKTFLDRKETAERAADRLRLLLEQVAQQQRTLPREQDPTELRLAVRRAQKSGDLDEQWLRAESALQIAERQAAVELEQLPLFHGSLDQLEQLAVPTVETVERFDAEFTAAERAVQQAVTELQRCLQQQIDVRGKLDRLQSESGLPSESDLARSRQRREAAWRQLLQFWRRPPGNIRELHRPADAAPPNAGDPSAALEEPLSDVHAAWEELAAEFGARVDEADRVVDRLRQDAGRVAERSLLLAEAQQLDRQVALQQTKRGTCEDHRAELQARWQAVWEDTVIEPLAPREMRSWLHQQQSLARTAASIRQQRDQFAQIANRRLGACRELTRCLQQLGQQPREDMASLSAVVEQSEGLIASIDQVNLRRSSLAEQTLKLQAELAEAELAVLQASSQQTAWRNEWATALAAVGLSAAATPSAAQAVMDALDALQALVKEADGLEERIAGIDSDARVFRAAVQDLLIRVAEDLRETPVDQAVPQLVDRLEMARQAQAQVDAWQARLPAEIGKRDEALRRAEQQDTILRSLCALAGCQTVEELAAAEQRSLQRRESEREFRDVEIRLTELAAGVDIERFVHEAQALDADQLRADLQQLSDRIEQLEQEKTQVAEEVGRRRHEMQQMDGRDQAAEAREQSEQLVAQLRTEAAQYVRLKLASVVLRRAIERYREESQGPVLAAASQFFADLTQNSFSGIRAEYDQRGQPVLVGVRAGTGELVGVAGMSTGTCDQLYLALRLAILEAGILKAESQQREALPLILDDILIMFDDDRALAALQLLARLSRRTQVIFFTHHNHLVQLAKANLDHEVLFVHPLSDRPPTAKCDIAPGAGRRT